MVVADLHVHTTNSDGILTLEDLPAAAERAGVAVVAVTDHDRLHDDIDAPLCRVDGLMVVHGIELRVETGDQRVDLLGYGVERTDALGREIAHIQEDRIERSRAIVGCIEDRLGVAIDVEARRGIGRPHIARAVADHPGTTYDYQAVFDRLIGVDCPCYVARDVPSFDRGRDLLSEACGLVALAHPLRYDDPSAALARCADLDAVELHYPYEGDVDRRPVERAIEAHDLVVTGGSDAHGDEIGRSGLSREEYRRFRAEFARA